VQAEDPLFDHKKTGDFLSGLPNQTHFEELIG
jgi:hypothetical protein